MYYEMTIVFRADDEDVAKAYYEIAKSIAPWMVDNVESDLTSMEVRPYKRGGNHYE